MADAAARYSAPQCRGDMILHQQVGKAARAVFASESDHESQE